MPIETQGKILKDFDRKFTEFCDVTRNFASELFKIAFDNNLNNILC
jgi:hypothetical protein